MYDIYYLIHIILKVKDSDSASLVLSHVIENVAIVII